MNNMLKLTPLMWMHDRPTNHVEENVTRYEVAGGYVDRAIDGWHCDVGVFSSPEEAAAALEGLQQ
jgi:hypothetical protein